MFKYVFLIIFITDFVTRILTRKGENGSFFYWRKAHENPEVVVGGAGACPELNSGTTSNSEAPSPRTNKKSFKLGGFLHAKLFTLLYLSAII